MQTTHRSDRRVSPRLPVLCALTLAIAGGAAQAQESNFGLNFGTKVWVADWSTWFIQEDGSNREFVSQESAKTKAMVIPQLSFRYRDFIGSVSGAVNTTHSFERFGGPAEFKRREADVNFGYHITPGLAATLGYKKFDQINSAGVKIYQVSGPTLGVSAASPLSGGFSVYGSLGLGVLSIKGVEDVSADYTLNEVGLAYTLPFGRFVKAVNFSLGYRTQVIKAKGISLSSDTTNVNAPVIKQDARDTTQGFTLAAVIAF